MISGGEIASPSSRRFASEPAPNSGMLDVSGRPGRIRAIRRRGARHAARPAVGRLGDRLMPGSVQNAAPLTVMPASLSRSLRTRGGLSGRRERVPERRVATAGLSDQQPQEVELAEAADALAVGRAPNVYDARNGSHEPFYFYDPYETNRSSRMTRPGRRLLADTRSGSISIGISRSALAGGTNGADRSGLTTRFTA